MNLFLRAKHWQLFLLSFGIPILLEIVCMAFLFSDIMRNHNPDPAMIFSAFKFFPVIIILSTGTLFGWFWAVAIGLQKLVPEGINMKVSKFKIFFFIPLIYLTLLVILISFIFTGNLIDTVNDSSFFMVFSIIFPLHLFCMFCIFYCLYFVAKTFKTVELQRDVSISDFIGEFFLIWFFPIGVWIIQPKINRMIAQHNEIMPEDLPPVV